MPRLRRILSGFVPLPLLACVGLLAVGAGATAGPRPPAALALPAPPAVPRLAGAPQPGLVLGISGADDALTAGSTADTGAWTGRAHAVEAQIIRVGVGWASVAPDRRPAGFDATNPDSPGYRWSAVDAKVRRITAEGFRILLETEGAPRWAEGPHRPAGVGPGTWEPNPNSFGQFAAALAQRYSGHFPDPLQPGADLPRVGYWQAWNEPNLSRELTPQWLRAGSTEIAVSPLIYRGLENAFYAGVKGVSGRNVVVAAGTAPYGDPPGGARMSPVTFDQHLLCLTATDHHAPGCAAVTRMDAIDDHPYVSGLCCLGPTWHAAFPNDTSIADVYKIAHVLHAAEAARTVGPGHPALWASEVGWNTNPPDRHANQASPAALVGLWADQALYVLWAQGVSTVLWFQLEDDAEPPGGWDTAKDNAYSEGLYLRTGRAKPAAAAFAFPFLTQRAGRAAVKVWGRAPRTGTLYVERRAGRIWRPVGRLAARAGQVFYVTAPERGAGDFRATVAGQTSPVWHQTG